MMNERDRVALAALLHEIGAFPQRAGASGDHATIGSGFVEEWRNLFPQEWVDDLRDAIANHHRPPNKSIERLVKLADWIASGEPEPRHKSEDQGLRSAVLIPITSRVDLFHEPPRQAWGYPLRRLSLEKAAIFPDVGLVNTDKDYADLWRAFKGEITPVRLKIE